MPSTPAQAKAGNVTIHVTDGGSHAPEDFPSDLIAKRVAGLLAKFGFTGIFTIYPGSLRKGGGQPWGFGRMLIHRTNSRGGIECSANFEERSNRHFAFNLALPGDLEAAKTILELRGHLELEYGSSQTAPEDYESEMAASSSEPPLDLLPLAELESAYNGLEQARTDKAEAQGLLNEAQGRETAFLATVERARAMVAQLPELERLEREFDEEIGDLRRRLDLAEERRAIVQTQIANYRPLRDFLGGLKQP